MVVTDEIAPFGPFSEPAFNCLTEQPLLVYLYYRLVLDAFLAPAPLFGVLLLELLGAYELFFVIFGVHNSLSLEAMTGIEPAYKRFADACIYPTCSIALERVAGIEPTFIRWQRIVLPLNYTRMYTTEFVPLSPYGDGALPLCYVM